MDLLTTINYQFLLGKVYDWNIIYLQFQNAELHLDKYNPIKWIHMIAYLLVFEREVDWPCLFPDRIIKGDWVSFCLACNIFSVPKGVSVELIFFISCKKIEPLEEQLKLVTRCV